jgi:hypothetical protein
MEDQIKQSQELIKSLQSDLDAVIATRKDLQSQLDEQKQIRDKMRTLNQSALETISTLRKKISASDDASEIQSLGNEISNLETLRQGFATQLTAAVETIIELNNTELIEKQKAAQIKSQLKQNRELLKTLQASLPKTKKNKKAEAPAIESVAEVSAATAVQSKAAKKPRKGKKGTKSPGMSLVPYSTAGELTKDVDENVAIITSADGSIQQVPVTEISNVQKSASTSLTARRGLRARRGVAQGKGTEVGFHDPLAGIPYADYEILQDPLALRQQRGLPGARKLSSGAPAGFIGAPAPTKAIGAGKRTPLLSSGGPAPKLLGAGPPPPQSPSSFWNPSPLPPTRPPNPPTIGPVNLVTLMKGFSTLALVMKKFADKIEETSRILSTDWTDAAKILVERIGYSFISGVKSIFGSGRFAKMEEIKQAQEQFGQQFGGVMRTDAATELAGAARKLNVMPQQYIAALRPLSGMLGGIEKGTKRLNSTTAAFMNEGLTGKDAMQFIAENSNLIARNGGRFADSLNRAAIEAKKAGYSLQSIEGFGDRIVGDFEGFLEDATAMAAMGMQFDVSSLAEAAVSGDTERLKNELQSQLQAQGLSLENMNRAQRMQLEKTVGMPLEEALKITNAPETAGSVTAQLDTEAAQIQSKAANLFRVAVAAFGVAATIFSAAVAIDAVSRRAFAGRGMFTMGRTLAGRARFGVAAATRRAGALATRLPGAFTVRNAARAVGGSIRSAGGALATQFPRVAALPGRLGMTPRLMGAGLGLGVAGSLLDMGGDKLKAAGYEKTGAAADIAGKAASFGGVGLMFGPIGGAVGVLVGTIYGIVTNWEAVKKMFSSAVDGIVTAFGAIVNAGKWLGEKLFAIGKFLFDNNPVVIAFRALADKIKSFNLLDFFRNPKPVSQGPNTYGPTTGPSGYTSPLGAVKAPVGRYPILDSLFKNLTPPVSQGAVMDQTTTSFAPRDATEMQSDTNAIANTRTSAPIINLPDNATLQQQVTELIRQTTVSNQKLDALANQTITVNMDGQKVGNIIRRSAMAASTGASTARSNG